jgi:membrane-bound metal-dependent hydrolase YbcI (DUF457 family)
MFVGHLAAALGAKRAAPRLPLGALVAAAFGLDLLWPVLLLAGIETVRIEPGNTAFTPLAFDYYPWSHSLVMALLWGAVLAVLIRVAWKSAVGAALVGATVVSHWVLDWITHRPDLPLYPGGPETGLGLWHSIPGTIAVEGLLFAAAIEMYRRAFRPRDRVGRWSFRALIALTTIVWLSGPWSPPPPSAAAVAPVGLAMWLFPVWAGWIDRHRDPPI